MLHALVLAASLDSWRQLPAYHPQSRVSGTIRDYGFGFGGLLEKWETAFRRYQPGIRFADTLPTSDAAIPALITRVTDLAPDGGEPSLTQSLAFYESHGYDPTGIVVASGAYDDPGHSNGPIVYVSARNPLTHLTMQQLDGIFGAQRTGALDGFKWMTSARRSAASDIRTWGALGLRGAWAGKPIQTYGYAPSGTARFFQLRVLGNSDKWNPNYREFVPSGTKMIGPDDPQQAGGLHHMLADELARDPYGIGWATAPDAAGISGLKAIAIAPAAGDAYVTPSTATFENRTYPLVRNVYIYFARSPGSALDPKMREFLRFILSRDGQAIVRGDGHYLPLPPAAVREQLTKLE
jgi:phosphate transport system substrate-binding protein